MLLPHIASGSVHTRNAMGKLVADNLISWFDGKGPLTPVAGDALYGAGGVSHACNHVITGLVPVISIESAALHCIGMAGTGRP